MILSEAIEHAESKAYELGDCECAKEHKQIADWLKELQQLRNKDEKLDVIIHNQKVLENAIERSIKIAMC